MPGIVGLPLEGSVADENGQPAAGARVGATWQKTDGQYYTLGSDQAGKEMGSGLDLQLKELFKNNLAIATLRHRGTLAAYTWTYDAAGRITTATTPDGKIKR